MAHVLITKADGEQEPFHPDKLEASLARAGASSTVRAQILARIMHELRSGMMTEEIYRHAFEMLRHQEVLPVAARYSVKRAIFALGPSGFPFEAFFAEVMRAQGWRAKTDMILMGRCAGHEVDVVAEKDGKRVAVEAKFHNDPGGKTDIQTALYVHARHLDLKESADPHSRSDEGWLVTNTRFTRNAISYAQCVGLTLIGWEYPRRGGLADLIEDSRVHPLTALTTLSDTEKRRLLENRIVLCRDLRSRQTLEQFGVRPSSIPAILEEANNLCG